MDFIKTRVSPYLQTFKLWTFEDANTHSQVQSRKLVCLVHSGTYTHHPQVVVLVYFSAQHCIEYSSIVVAQSLSHVRVFVSPRFIGFLVLHHLPQFAQTHVRWVDDAIQPSYPLSSLSPPALNLSQHQGLFQWVSSSHQVAKVLELQLQHQSFPVNIQGWFPLGLTGLISLQSKGLLRVFSSTTAWKPKFYST